MLLIKLSIYGRKFMVIPQQVTSYQSTKLKKMVKFYVPTWTLFAGPVTFVICQTVLHASYQCHVVA